jgi:hypothetical protein
MRRVPAAPGVRGCRSALPMRMPDSPHASQSCLAAVLQCGIAEGALQGPADAVVVCSPALDRMLLLAAMQARSIQVPHYDVVVARGQAHDVPLEAFWRTSPPPAVCSRCGRNVWDGEAGEAGERGAACSSSKWVPAMSPCPSHAQLPFSCTAAPPRPLNSTGPER